MQSRVGVSFAINFNESTPTTTAASAVLAGKRIGEFWHSVNYLIIWAGVIFGRTNL